VLIPLEAELDRLPTLLVAVDSPVDKLETLLFALLSPVDNELMPVEAEVERLS
jgi:hypothetical protein